MTLYCNPTLYPGFSMTVTCYYSSALERVINVNLGVCNLVPWSSLFVTSVWDSVCFLLCRRWVMRSFARASKASLWTGSLRACVCDAACETWLTVWRPVSPEMYLNTTDIHCTSGEKKSPVRKLLDCTNCSCRRLHLDRALQGQYNEYAHL